jgi:hypothetical protein
MVSFILTIMHVIVSWSLCFMSILIYGFRNVQSGELNRLSFYFDTDTKPWPMEKSWEELVPKDWNKVPYSPDLVYSLSAQAVYYCFSGGHNVG